MTTETPTKLDYIKSGFVNALVNSMTLNGLASAAGQHISRQFAELNEEEMRDQVISSNSKEVWEQLEAAATQQFELEQEVSTDK